MTDELLPDYPFRHALHDRIGERRRDDAFLDKAWSDERSRVLVLRGTDLAASEDGTALSWIRPSDAPSGERLLLGAADGVVHFALMPAPERSHPLEEFDDIQVSVPTGGDRSGLSFSPLRRLAMRLESLDASFAVHAVAMVGWHLKHPHCSVCGDSTRDRAGRRDAVVPKLRHRPLPAHRPGGDHDWSSTTTTAACSATTPPAPRAGTPPWPASSSRGRRRRTRCVREVAEEIGVVVDEVTYLGAQPWPFPSSLMLGFNAHASSSSIAVDGVEITEARWFTRDELRTAVEAGEVGSPDDDLDRRRADHALVRRGPAAQRPRALTLPRGLASVEAAASARARR